MNEAGTPGTGWKEVYLGGSKDAEDALIKRQFAVEINRIQRSIQRIEGGRSVKRAQHAMMRAGTKHAQFQVLPDIPADLRVGVFRLAKNYAAYVRFSNASSLRRPDSARDLRG